MGVPLTSGSVEMENNGDLLAGRSGRDGDLGSPNNADIDMVFWTTILLCTVLSGIA